jgi:mono/diheme cytochrome c family protein
MSASPHSDPQKPSRALPRIEQAGASDSDIERVHNVLMREKPEPIEGFSPLPLTLVAVFALLCGWAGIYIEKNRGNWDPLVYDFRHTGGGAAVAAAPPLTPESPEWLKRGQRLYASNCQACHGANGMGVPGAFPPLAGSEWVIGPESDYLLPRVLIHGLRGPIQVKGNEYNGNMPAQGTYTDAQIAQVLSFIRTEWGNGGAVFAAETIAEVRAKYGKRDPWTNEELRAGLAAP